MPQGIYKRTDKHNQRMSESCKNAIVVHHINGNHFDDRPENRILLTNREHTQLHLMQGDIKPFGGGLKKGCRGSRLGIPNKKQKGGNI